MNNTELPNLDSLTEALPHPKIPEWEQTIRRLVDDNRIIEARQLLAEISQIGCPVSETLKGWQLALALPKVRVGNRATGVYLNKNYQWVKKNAQHFKGQWVALKEGTLVDSHESLMTLRRTVEQAGKLAGVIFRKIEANGELS